MTMKKLFTLCAAAVALFAGSAMADEYKLNVGQFDKILVDDNVNVVYRCNPDSAGVAYFEGEKELANFFVFSNNKGKLRIQFNKESTYRPTHFPTIYVYSDFLTGAENNSDFHLTIDTDLSTPSLNLKQSKNGMIIAKNVKTNEVDASVTSGNGAVHIEGVTSKAAFNITGAGQIEASNLQSKNVNCVFALSSGTVMCWADDHLNVKGLGSGKVHYRGTPQIKKFGGGTLIPIKD